VEFNFIHKDHECDKDLFFGPIVSEDEFISLEDNWTMANIVCEAKIFPSLSQARKNGYDKKIPDGFTDIKIGKLKHRIVILNCF